MTKGRSTIPTRIANTLNQQPQQPQPDEGDESLSSNPKEGSKRSFSVLPMASLLMYIVKPFEESAINAISP